MSTDRLFSVDVLSAAGVVQGAGPLANVVSASITEQLDGAGAVAISVPATDVNALAVLDTELYLRIRTLDGLARIGIIRSKKTSGGKSPLIVVSGPDLIDELNTLTCGIARIYDNETVANIVADLIVDFGAVWTADVAGGLGSLTARFDGGTRLFALQALRQRLGVHFRQSTTARTLEFKPFGSDSGVRLHNVEHWRQDLEDSEATIGIIDSLELVEESTNVVNRVIPLGAGDGQGQLDLRYVEATRAANVLTREGPNRGATVGSGTAGDMYVSVSSTADFAAGDPLFIGDTTDLSVTHEINQIDSVGVGQLNLIGPLQNTYGGATDVVAWPEFYIQESGLALSEIRERLLVWKDIAPISNSDADLEAAANALYDVAAAYMDQYSEAQSVYRVKVATLPTSVHVGDKLRLVYKGIVTRDGSIYSYLDVDALFWVLKLTRTYNADGSRAVAIEISNVDRAESSDNDIVATALQNGEVWKTYTQSFPCVFRDTAREPMDSTHTATFYLDIDDSVLYLNKARVRLRTFPFRAFATAAASGGGSTSGPSSTSTTASGGGSTPTSSSGGGETVSSAGSAHRHIIAVMSTGGISGSAYTGDIPANTGGGGSLDKIAQVELEADDDSGTPWGQLGTYADSPAHTHNVTTSNHTHTVTIAAHTHNMPHTHTTPDHTHDLTYGIHEDTEYPDEISLAINGTDVTSELGGPWAVGGGALDTEIDITEFIRNAGGGLRQVHELEFSCDSGQGMIEVIFKLLETVQSIVVS